MAVMITVNQQAHIPQRFVEQDTSYQMDTHGPDPELKKILPLVFASIHTEEDFVDQEEEESTDNYTPFFTDFTQGIINKSESSQRVLPIHPDDLTGVSSHFSRYHPGVDYRANIGTSIRAILPGVVNEIGYERGGYGRYVVLVHHVDGKTLFSLYAHLKSTSIPQGKTVDAGQKIGEVGMTGRTTGPHLHFELHDNTTAMDPMKFFAGSTLALGVK